MYVYPVTLLKTTSSPFTTTPTTRDKFEIRANGAEGYRLTSPFTFRQVRLDDQRTNKRDNCRGSLVPRVPWVGWGSSKLLSTWQPEDFCPLPSPSNSSRFRSQNVTSELVFLCVIPTPPKAGLLPLSTPPSSGSGTGVGVTRGMAVAW